MLGKRKRTGSYISKRPTQYRRIVPSIYSGRISRRGGEKKFFETTVALNPTATGVIEPSLNLIPQGVTESTRIGRKCVITKISLRGAALTLNDTGQGSEIWRIIVYLDKQANGAAATVADILQAADEKAFNNLANSQRFVTVKEWYFRTIATAFDGTNYNQYGKVLKWNHKCNIPLEFSSTTGAITELRSNNIGILAVVGNATGTTALNLTSRVRFSDN